MHRSPNKLLLVIFIAILLTEHYTSVLFLGNTNSSSLATSCLGVLTTYTQTENKAEFIVLRGDLFFFFLFAFMKAT